MAGQCSDRDDGHHDHSPKFLSESGDTLRGPHSGSPRDAGVRISGCSLMTKSAHAGPENTQGQGLRYGDPDGFGRFGILEESPDGVTCHQCGSTGAHLGVHSARQHGVRAIDYKISHGLRRSKGLVATATRQKLREGAGQRYTDNGPLAASRRLFNANAARLAAARPASAEEVAERDARFTKTRRSSRTGRVVICEGCLTSFCPLVGAARRRFCSMSCSNKHNRAMGTAKRKRPMAEPEKS